MVAATNYLGGAFPLLKWAGTLRDLIGRREWVRTTDPHHVKVVL